MEKYFGWLKVTKVPAPSKACSRLWLQTVHWTLCLTRRPPASGTLSSGAYKKQLKHYKNLSNMEKYPSGSRGSPAKGVVRL